MGEEKTNRDQVLLVRLQWPTDGQMIVQVSPRREFLERCLKLMLICQKIRLTMGGAGQVIVESHGHLYVSIHSETAIRRLVSLARVRDWAGFQHLWVTKDFYIGECRVAVGIRQHSTHIEEDAIWFEGIDDSHHFISVRLSRAWVRRELDRMI